MMRRFRYFLLGILFITMLIPILEEITQIILALLEWVKGKIMLPVTKLNKNIQKIAGDEEMSSKSHPVGFAAAIAENEDYEDEDI